MISRSTPPLSGEKQKLVRALRRGKERQRHALYLCEGLRLVTELVHHPQGVRFIYGIPSAIAILPELPSDIPLYALTDESDTLFLTENSQGIGAVVERRGIDNAEEFHALPGPLLVLDRIADPGNAGTIMRSADWFGLDGVGFLSGSVDPWNPKSVRASMGALLRLKPALSLSHEIFSMGRPVIALEADGDLALGACELPPDGLYVVGSEAHGIDPAIVPFLQGSLRIPGARGESLNAAMAATLLCYELRDREAIARS